MAESIYYCGLWRSVKWAELIGPRPKKRVISQSGNIYRHFSKAAPISQTHSLVDPFPSLIRNKEMDTSNPAVFVNADLLRMHVGRRVRAVIKVLKSDGGGSVIGKSTDEQQLVIKGHPPGPLTTFVEVIGVADSNQSIRAEIWTNFGDVLDTGCYNSVCQLANGDYRHLFI